MKQKATKVVRNIHFSCSEDFDRKLLETLTSPYWGDVFLSPNEFIRHLIVMGLKEAIREMEIHHVRYALPEGGAETGGDAKIIPFPARAVCTV